MTLMQIPKIINIFVKSTATLVVANFLVATSHAGNYDSFSIEAAWSAPSLDFALPPTSESRCGQNGVFFTELLNGITQRWVCASYDESTSQLSVDTWGDFRGSGSPLARIGDTLLLLKGIGNPTTELQVDTFDLNTLTSKPLTKIKVSGTHGNLRYMGGADYTHGEIIDFIGSSAAIYSFSTGTLSRTFEIPYNSTPIPGRFDNAPGHELLTTRHSSSEFFLQILSGTDGHLIREIAFPGDPFLLQIYTIKDLDADGFDEIVVGSPNYSFRTSYFYVFDPNSSAPPLRVNSAPGVGLLGINAIDWDNSGPKELAVAWRNEISVFDSKTGSNRFRINDLGADYGAFEFRGPFVFDLDRDAKEDILWRSNGELRRAKRDGSVQALQHGFIRTDLLHGSPPQQGILSLDVTTKESAITRTESTITWHDGTTLVTKSTSPPTGDWISGVSVYDYVSRIIALNRDKSTDSRIEAYRASSGQIIWSRMIARPHGFSHLTSPSSTCIGDQCRRLAFVEKSDTSRAVVVDASSGATMYVSDTCAGCRVSIESFDDINDDGIPDLLMTESRTDTAHNYVEVVDGQFFTKLWELDTGSSYPASASVASNLLTPRIAVLGTANSDCKLRILDALDGSEVRSLSLTTSSLFSCKFELKGYVPHSETEGTWLIHNDDGFTLIKEPSMQRIDISNLKNVANLRPDMLAVGNDLAIANGTFGLLKLKIPFSNIFDDGLENNLPAPISTQNRRN